MKKIFQWFSKRCFGFHDWQYENTTGKGIIGCMLRCKKCGKIELLGYGTF